MNCKKIIISAKPAGRKLNYILVMAFLVWSPLLGICQIIPPDPPQGVNPDVPFDDNMNLLFLGVAILFVVYVIWKKQIIKKVTVQ